MLRRTVLLALAVALLLAGCAAKDPAPTASTPPASSTPAPAPGPSQDQGNAAPAIPTSVTLKDAGDVQGQFEKTWDLNVPAVGFRDALVQFNLTGASDGAPPTAHVYLSLLDASGKEVKGQAIGLGESANTLKWTLSPSQLGQGAYKLKATSQPGPVALPSGGLGKFSLYAAVAY